LLKSKLSESRAAQAQRYAARQWSSEML